MLLSAVPVPDPALERRRSRAEIRLEPPDPGKPLPGCRFQRSCRFATETCRRERPVLRRVSDQEGHTAACHHMDRPDVRAAMYSKTAETIA
jgi:oligopeptide/dipeptide ABC transporter ATP-binding protein